MIFQGAFIKLEPAECENVLADINPVLPGGTFDTGSVTVLGHEISFYPGYRFLDIADYESMPHLRKFVVYKPGDVNLLDWTSAPIYMLNAKAPLKLTLETAADYARFFFTYTRGPHGRFIIVENVDDIGWSDEPPPAARKAVGKLLNPVTVDGCGSDGGYRLSACLMLGNTLYKAAIYILQDGQVSLKDEEALVHDLPVRDDTLRL